MRPTAKTTGPVNIELVRFISLTLCKHQETSEQCNMASWFEQRECQLYFVIHTCMCYYEHNL